MCFIFNLHSYRLSLFSVFYSLLEYNQGERYTTVLRTMVAPHNSHEAYRN